MVYYFFIFSCCILPCIYFVDVPILFTYLWHIIVKGMLLCCPFLLFVTVSIIIIIIILIIIIIVWFAIKFAIEFLIKLIHIDRVHGRQMAFPKNRHIFVLINILKLILIFDGYVLNTLAIKLRILFLAFLTPVITIFPATCLYTQPMHIFISLFALFALRKLFIKIL
jgi:hypothetical protein